MARRKPQKGKKAPAPDRSDLDRPDPDRVEDQVDRFLQSADSLQEPAGPGPVETVDGSPADAPQPGQPDTDSGDITKEVAGPDGALLQLQISDDRLSATIPSLYPETTLEQVMALLKEHGVTHGIINRNAILKAIQTAREEGQCVTDAVVAAGTPPRSPGPTRLDHQPPGKLKALPKLDEVQKLLESRRLNDFRRELVEKLRGVTVNTDTLLAIRMVHHGKPGVGVGGEQIQPKPSEDDAANALLQPGEGIQLDNTFTYFAARHFGYAGLLEGRVSLLSPIWIDADGTTACYVHLPPLRGSSPPTEAEIHSLLSEAGVAVGIQEEALAALCAALANGEAVNTLTVLAKSAPAVPPQDGKVVFHFPHKPQAGSIRADGSIDFRERNVFPSVAKDALLAETVLPVPGTPGQSIYGQEIAVGQPANVELIAAEGTRVETAEEIQKVYAELDGGASAQEAETPDGSAKIRKYTLAVRPIAQIPGDVGYETGNIDFKGNVEIKGGIQGGFRVVATGDVTVAGAVEDGAKVEAGGDLKVQLGIVGGKTRVNAGANLMTKFILEAQVRANGNIVVGGYIHGGRVQSGARIQVEGNGGAGGGVVGSEVWGMQGIVSKNVGSERSTTTSLVAGIDPEAYEQLHRYTQGARQAQILMTNLLKSIELKELSSEAIQKRIAANPAKKNAVLHYVQKANQLAKVREDNLAKHRELESQILDASRNARIDVPEIAYSRVAMRIGNEIGNLQDDLRNVAFHIDPSGEKRGILMMDLSSAAAKSSKTVPVPGQKTDGADEEAALPQEEEIPSE